MKKPPPTATSAAKSQASVGKTLTKQPRFARMPGCKPIPQGFVSVWAQANLRSKLTREAVAVAKIQIRQRHYVPMLGCKQSLQPTRRRRAYLYSGGDKTARSTFLRWRLTFRLCRNQ